MSQEQKNNTVNIVSKLPIFERYLSLWVALCIVTGVIAGRFFPRMTEFLSQLEVAHVNIPVAILIWLMIYPMMVQIDFSSILRVTKQPKGLIITLVVNWLIKPFTMVLFAVIFLKYLFATFINPQLAKEYVAGAILLGAAPCTAMVFVWSYLTKGNPAHTLVQVAVNDLVILIAFVPIVKILLGVNQMTVPYETLIYSTVLFVVIPLVAGYISREKLIKQKGVVWLENIFLKFLKPITIIGLLLTLIILFAFQGNIILQNPFHIFLIAIPLTIQTYFIFAVAYLWARRWRLKHSIASPASMIGASNFFELAVAVAISLFGLKSGAALATVVGVLTEVPIMLSLVNFSNRTRHWFEGEEEMKITPVKIEKISPLWDRILITTDLSPNSERVIDCVAKSGKDFCSEAKLVHVISVETAGGISEELERQERPLLEKQVQILRTAGINTSYEFGYGVPFLEINRIIEKEKFSLIVLGSHGKGMFKELMLGSVCDSIIRNLKVPALLIKRSGVPEHCPFDLSGRVLFLTDFSQNAAEAFRFLARLSRWYPTKITLFHVQDAGIVYPHLGHRLKEFNKIDHQKLSEMKGMLLNYGAKEAEIKIEIGHPKQQIIREIDSLEYSLVVMGTQGRGWVDELLIGGVTHAVTRKSKSSLFLIPYNRA